MKELGYYEFSIQIKGVWQCVFRSGWNYINPKPLRKGVNTGKQLKKLLRHVPKNCTLFFDNEPYIGRYNDKVYASINGVQYVIGAKCNIPWRMVWVSDPLPKKLGKARVNGICTLLREHGSQRVTEETVQSFLLDYPT